MQSIIDTAANLVRSVPTYAYFIVAFLGTVGYGLFKLVALVQSYQG